MSENKIPKVSSTVNANFSGVVSITKTFCDERLNNEYYELALLLAAKIARKKLSPLLTGNIKTWAAGVIHALGMVNFLFDKSQAPHISSQDLALWFNLSQNNINGKSKSIRDMFKIRQLDPLWALPSNLDSNPLV